MNRPVIISVMRWMSEQPRTARFVDVLVEEYLKAHPEHRDPATKDERLELFRQDVFSQQGFPEQTVKDFFDYWTETRPQDKKHRWEKEKSWDTRKRMLRFWRNEVTSFGKHPEKWGTDGPVTQKQVAQGALEINAGRSWNRE